MDFQEINQKCNKLFMNLKNTENTSMPRKWLFFVIT